jgi:hypothetical protein
MTTEELEPAGPATDVIEEPEDVDEPFDGEEDVEPEEPEATQA